MRSPWRKPSRCAFVDGAGECLDDPGRRQDGKRPSFEVFAEILSLHELRDQEFGSVMTTAREDGDDVRVMQPRHTGVEVDEANVSGGPIPLGFDHFQGDATIPPAHGPRQTTPARPRPKTPRIAYPEIAGNVGLPGGGFEPWRGGRPMGPLPRPRRSVDRRAGRRRRR